MATKRRASGMPRAAAMTDVEFRQQLESRRPPSADEILAAITDHETYPKSHPLNEQLREVVDDYADAIRDAAFIALESPDPRDTEPDPTSLWCDLRPSEAIRLRELVEAAIARAVDRCRSAIFEELIVAGRAFAIEFPSAPRP